jgi:hypothetical protein
LLDGGRWWHDDGGLFYLWLMMVADLWCIDDEKKYVYFMVDDGFADDVAG